MSGTLLRLALSAAGAVAVLAVHGALPDTATPGQPPVAAPQRSESARAAERLGGAAAVEIAPAGRRLYRWRDGRGSLHLSTEADLVPAHADALDLPARRAPAAPPAGSPVVAAPDNLVESMPLAVYTPVGMEQLMDHARRLAREVAARDRFLDELVEAL